MVSDDFRKAVIRESDRDESDLRQGSIVNVKVIDAYCPYYYHQSTCEQDDGRIIPTKGHTYPSVDGFEEIEENPKVRNHGIEYDPKIRFIVEFDDEEQKYYFSRSYKSLSKWSPTENLAHFIHNTIGFDNLSEEKSIPFLYSQPQVNINLDGNNILSMRRRMQKGVPTDYEFSRSNETDEFTEDYSNISKYLDFVQETKTNPTNWVETEIKTIGLPKDDELPVLVETPLGTVRFTFPEKSGIKTIGYSELFDGLDISDTAELKEKTVYIRPTYRKFYDDMRSFKTDVCNYTINHDQSNKWELAVVNPNSKSETSLKQRWSHKLALKLENTRIESAFDKLNRKIATTFY